MRFVGDYCILTLGNESGKAQGWICVTRSRILKFMLLSNPLKYEPSSSFPQLTTYKSKLERVVCKTISLNVVKVANIPLALLESLTSPLEEVCGSLAHLSAVLRSQISTFSY